MQLEAGSAVEASPTFYQQEKLTKHTAYVPCPLAPLHSELWLMSTGMMFILGSWETLGRREEVGTTWSSFFSPFSAQALVILEGNIETSCPPASRET